MNLCFPIRQVLVYRLPAICILFLFFRFEAYSQIQQVKEALALFDRDSLLQHVEILSGLKPPGNQDTIYSRLANTQGNEKAFQYIKSKLIQYGFRVDSQVYSLQGKNLIASKQGNNLSGNFYLFGAHYDAVGGTLPPPLGKVYPGADDNASGVAALLESARVLGQFTWPLTIQLGFWDEEEFGLIGSKAYSPPNDINKFLGYVNYDMIAWDGNNDSLFEVHYNSVGKSGFMANKVIFTCSTYALALQPKFIFPGQPDSDHGAFWEDGLSAIGINEEYGGDFNPHWHKSSDSLAYFNLTYFTNMSKLCMAYMGELVSDKLESLESYSSRDINLAIFPNPANEFIRFTLPNGSIAAIDILSSTGQMIKQFNTIDSTIEIDVSDVKEGAYIIRINRDSGRFIGKFMVLR